MRKLLIVAAVLLSACGTDEYSTYDADQPGSLSEDDAYDAAADNAADLTYTEAGADYGCTADCSGHDAGYDWAADNGITDVGSCDGNSESFIEGCTAYAEEVQEQASVLEAEDSVAALRILHTSERVDLLFTDVVLPGKNGRELAGLAKELRPDLRVLFTTGYSRNAIVHHGLLDAGVHLISKPFTFDGLAARVRDILDGSAVGERAT